METVSSALNGKTKTNWSKLKEPENLLILLGFICQGLISVTFIIPITFVLLWFLCIRFSQNRQFIHKEIEFFIFFVSLAICFIFSGNDDIGSYTSLYLKAQSIGYSLLTLQSLRLLWPLSKREKLFSVAISITHLAIGSQVVFGYSFLLILIAAFVLIPKTISKVMSEDYNECQTFTLFNNKLNYLIMIVVMAIFFIGVPRSQLFSEVNRLMARTTGGERNAPIQPLMETAGGAGATSDQTIFQIQGNDIGYLKSYALDKFDGNTWSVNKNSYRTRRDFKRTNLENYSYRKVTVKNSQLLGNALPVDGYVINMKGNFFRDEYISFQGNVIVSKISNESNSEYEYWIDTEGKVRIYNKELARYLTYPKQSKRLRNWLSNIVGSENDAEKITYKIEQHFQTNFKYELGMPDLKRLNPVEDFIFGDKRGHCERFASALSLLLRMSGIPSRVAIGYYPAEKNRFANFYKIKAKHAHAWSEAYIQGKGWITLDATPISDGSSTINDNSFTHSVMDWVEYVWYSRIVNFSVQDQSSIFTFTKDKLGCGIIFLLKNMKLFILGIIILLVSIFCITFDFKIFKIFQSNKKSRNLDIKETSNFYKKMLNELAKDNFHRPPNQTPFEFLNNLRKANHPKYNAIKTITEYFCLIKYGNYPLNENLRNSLDNALAEIKN